MAPGSAEKSPSRNEGVAFKQGVDGYRVNRQYLDMLSDTSSKYNKNVCQCIVGRPVPKSLSNDLIQNVVVVVPSTQPTPESSSHELLDKENISPVPRDTNNSASASSCRAVQNSDGFTLGCTNITPATNVCYYSNPFSQHVACPQGQPLVPSNAVVYSANNLHDPTLLPYGNLCLSNNSGPHFCIRNSSNIQEMNGYTPLSLSANNTIVHGLGTILNKFRSKCLVSVGDPAYRKNSVEVLHYLYASFLDQQGCDAILRTKDGDVMTHQVILGAYSPTVDAHLKSVKRPIQQTVMIKIPDCSMEAVADLLNFLYTTDVVLNCLNIGFITDAANQLDIPILMRLCNDYLIETLEVDNAFLHLSVAINNNFVAAVEILKFIALNFFDLVDHEHMLVLPFDKFATIITHPALCAKEIEVFRAIVNWVNCNRQGRLRYGKDLLSLVRFQLIDPEELANQVELQDWIFADTGCKNVILEAYKYHALSSSKNCSYCS